MMIEGNLTAVYRAAPPLLPAEHYTRQKSIETRGDAVCEPFRHHPEIKVTLIIASTPPRRTSTLHLFAIVGSGQ